MGWMSKTITFIACQIFTLLRKMDLLFDILKMPAETKKKSIKSHSKTRTSSSLSLFPISAQRRFNKWMICPSEYWDRNCILIFRLSTHRLDVHLHLQNHERTQSSRLFAYMVFYMRRILTVIYLWITWKENHKHTFEYTHEQSLCDRSSVEATARSAAAASIKSMIHFTAFAANKHIDRSVGELKSALNAAYLRCKSDRARALATQVEWVEMLVCVCMSLAHFQSPQLLSLGESLWSSLSVPNPEIFLCYASY